MEITEIIYLMYTNKLQLLSTLPLSKIYKQKIVSIILSVSTPQLLFIKLNLMTKHNTYAEWFNLGDLLAEEEVLQWLVLQKTEDRIETVNRNMLEVMLVDSQYLAVFFCESWDKPNITNPWSTNPNVSRLTAHSSHLLWVMRQT